MFLHSSVHDGILDLRRCTKLVAFFFDLHGKLTSWGQYEYDRPITRFEVRLRRNERQRGDTYMRDPSSDAEFIQQTSPAGTAELLCCGLFAKECPPPGSAKYGTQSTFFFSIISQHNRGYRLFVYRSRSSSAPFTIIIVARILSQQDEDIRFCCYLHTQI